MYNNTEKNAEGAKATRRAVSKERLGDWSSGEWGAIGGIVLAVVWWPRGGVTRQGVVLADLQSLLDCQ
jgi:hypothetical protein